MEPPHDAHRAAAAHPEAISITEHKSLSAAKPADHEGEVAPKGEWEDHHKKAFEALALASHEKSQC